MRTLFLVLVTASVAAASPAFAGGGTRGDWEIGVYGGYPWVDDYGIYRPKDDLLYGARLGYFITPGWNLEFAAQRIPTETDFANPALADLPVELDALRLNMNYTFAPGSKFRPHLSAGAGNERTDIRGFSEAADWGWNAGGGFRVFFTPNFNFRADGRVVGMNVDAPVNERQNNVEATAGLNLVFGGEREEEPPPPPANQPPVVACAVDRSEILPGESVRIVATASDPEGDPLTYAWSTSMGQVTGTGTTATLEFNGAAPPANATVTVRVSDEHGNTATSDCGVRLLEPVRKAESVSCLAGGFPRNLSRITNVDKACLDDVAQKLNADPRARVIVIGHADRRERSPEGLAKERANAIEDYLEEAGIDATRITTRSVGDTRMLDNGTDATAMARNRRVEVWFVPEGATIPE